MDIKQKTSTTQMKLDYSIESHQTKSLCFKGDKCSCGKNSKEYLTVLLCCNIKGEFKQPLVIGKAKKPRCFKNINPKTLSLHRFSNRKSWMIQDIMSEWLIDFDKKTLKKKK